MTAKAKQGSQTLAIGGKTARPARVQGIDQIWIINLDRRRDRLERFMQAHPEMLGRINRLPAYDGRTLELTPDIARLFATNNFDWHKPTMGCAMSHLALWQKLADDPDDHAAYLILEDDARLSASWVASVERAFNSAHMPGDWEVLFLGGILPKYRAFFEQNIHPLNRSIGRVKPDCKFGTNPAGYFHFCAYAYLLNKRGAQCLLDLVRSGGGIWMQADFLACYTTPDLQPARPVYFLNPLPAHSFQDAEGGVARPYGDGDEGARVDSDIWKKDDRFSEEEISGILDRGSKLDIPGALGFALTERFSSESAGQPAAPAKEVYPPQTSGAHTVGATVPQNLGHMVLEGHLGGFFSEGDGGTYYPLMWSHLVRKHAIRSVLDVGCGRGYSALYFKSLGCSIKGIDGSDEARKTNLIGGDFVPADYAAGPSSVEGQFDLVWSCEFVEHVEEKFMANYLRDFRRGKFLAMTFASPGQPGHHHVNCRPHEYWIRILHSQGFDYLAQETADLREYVRKDMEKNNSESEKRFVYHFIERGLFFRRTDQFDSHKHT